MRRTAVFSSIMPTCTLTDNSWGGGRRRERGAGQIQLHVLRRSCRQEWRGAAATAGAEQAASADAQRPPDTMADSLTDLQPDPSHDQALRQHEHDQQAGPWLEAPVVEGLAHALQTLPREDVI